MNGLSNKAFLLHHKAITTVLQCLVILSVPTICCIFSLDEWNDWQAFPATHTAAT